MEKPDVYDDRDSGGIGFEVPRCPECGAKIYGVCDNVPGTALLSALDDGTYLWAGETKIDWNGQDTPTDADGRVTAVCRSGHEWQTRMA